MRTDIDVSEEDPDRAAPVMSETSAEPVRPLSVNSPTADAPTLAYTLHPLTGFPVITGGRVVTLEDVKALEDE